MNNRSIINRSFLARNTFLNLAGYIVPAVMAFFAVPYIIEQLQVEKFSILAICWSILNYAYFLDFGLGRSITYLIAKSLRNPTKGNINYLIRLSFILASIVGVVFCLLALLIILYIDVKHESNQTFIFSETITSLKIVILFLPFIITQNVLKGILEAFHRFDLINFFLIISSIFTILSPILLLQFTDSIANIVIVWILGKFFVWVSYLLVCLPLLKNNKAFTTIDNQLLKQLVEYSGWVGISSFISQLMVYSDRFVLSIYLPISTVAYYITPFEIVNKLTILPVALNKVLFPTFSFLFSNNFAKIERYFRQSVNLTGYIFFSIGLITITFAYEILHIWLGEAFALKSAQVIQILMIGVFFNSIAQIYYSLLMSSGRSDIVGKLHLFELPIYMVLFWIFIPRLGIIGAALAWTLRVVLDMIGLVIISRNLMTERFVIETNTVKLLITFVCSFFIALCLDNLLIKLIYVTLSLVLCYSYIWFSRTKNDATNLLNFFIR